MHADLLAWQHEAEDHYLQDEELQDFELQLHSLNDRLALYEMLREQEHTIFQTIVDQITNTQKEDVPEFLESSLKRWIAVLRYGAMAMLLNNPEFLEHRLLEWLPEIITVHQSHALEHRVYEKLVTILVQTLSEPQWGLLEPFLANAYQVLVENTDPSAAIAL